MHLIDWIILAAYLVIALIIGLYFTKKASHNIEDFFVAGRSLSWFVLGTSMVATTFSADTPLFVASISRQTGIFENWLWWSAAMGGMAGVFFFSYLWRRSEVVTELEFLSLRYPPSRLNSGLRIFKVFFEGIIMNCTLMGGVTIAVGKIIRILVPESEAVFFSLPVVGELSLSTLLLLSIGLCAVIYSSLSGLYGVVYTDLIQFSLAMIGSIVLAIIVYTEANSGAGMMQKLNASTGFRQNLLFFFPSFEDFNLLSFTFLIYMTIAWWGQASGSGNMVQRLLAAKTEQDSMKGFFWYNICHYIIRPWPWIIVGIMSLIYLPDITDSESSFPLMIDKFLPAGLKGLMVASLFAAYMSTIDTHLNWGSSYVINDLYKPYLKPGEDAKHYVAASRVVMLVITLLAIVIALQLESILQVYKYVVLVGGGIGTVLVARWYWWRVNIYAEITAYALSFVLAPVLTIFISNGQHEDYFAIRLIIITTVVTISWITVAYLMSTKPDNTTLEFYKRLKIGGPGWRMIEKQTGIAGENKRFLKSIIGWALSCLMLYGALLGIGKLLFHQWVEGISYLLIAVLSGYFLQRGILKGVFDKHRE